MLFVYGVVVLANVGIFVSNGVVVSCVARVYVVTSAVVDVVIVIICIAVVGVVVVVVVADVSVSVVGGGVDDVGCSGVINNTDIIHARHQQQQQQQKQQQTNHMQQKHIRRPQHNYKQQHHQQHHTSRIFNVSHVLCTTDTAANNTVTKRIPGTT